MAEPTPDALEPGAPETAAGPDAPPPADTDADSPAEAWLGRVVGGRYRLDEVLGEGGIAVVYAAQDTTLGRSVAVKVLKETTAVSPELRGRFEREARVLAALSHPHVVSLLDFGTEDGAAYLVMERLRGRTLGELLEAETRLPLERALDIARQVLGALAYAHGQGLLHRDLKPDNVYLQELDTLGDHVQLLDFGFAKFVGPGREEEGGRALTQAGKVFGTPRYMAPEQLGGGTVDARADLYAVAVILYEMLSGRRPFEGEVRDVLRAKVVEDPPPLAAALPEEEEVAAEVEAFFAKALATSRSDRFADTASFLAALDAVPRPWFKPRAAAMPERAPPPARRTPPLLLLGLGALAVLGLPCVVSIALWIASGEEAPAPITRVEPPPTTPAPTPGPEPEARTDPWTGGPPLAAPVAFARDAIEAGEPIDADLLRELRTHASEHPEDARAQLLLGHVFAQRGMRAMSIGAYERAIELDPVARADPRVLADLLEMVAAGAREGPGRVIRRHFADEAGAAIDEALSAGGLDARQRERLRELRASL